MSVSDLRSKRPRLGSGAAEIRLTPEERLVMARIDGELSVDGLAQVTGIPPARLDAVVTRLADAGAIELEDAHTSLADLAAAVGMDPSSFGAIPAAQPSPEQAPTREELEMLEELPEIETAHAHEDEDVPHEIPPLEELPDLDDAEEPGRAVAERDYRQLYQSKWHPLVVDQRILQAKTVRGADLFALCFDPDARVIAAILENPTTGLDHVRLVAAHHRTSTGLEIVSRRQDFMHDGMVERRLLRNPMVGDIVLGRIMNPKRVYFTYKIAIDRDVPEITRVKCRGLMRKKWQTAPPEERADLLLRTEARCLVLMTGCTFDAKTTAILCGRPINSVMFVQSIVKFAASPPALLAHLYKQAFVRKSPPLKKMLLGHPNLPGDLKRGL